MAKTSYFDQMIKQYGDNFVNLIKPEQIQYAAKKIVKDMVKNDVDYPTHGKYFLEPKFLDNLIIALTNELETVSLYYNAVAFFQMYYPATQNITVHLSHLSILCTVYSTILNKLYVIKETGNIGCLVDVSAILYNYRSHLM